MSRAKFKHAEALDISSDLDVSTKFSALFVGTGGTVHVELAKDEGADVTFKNVSNGTTLEIEVRKIYADSTADDILGLN